MIAEIDDRTIKLEISNDPDEIRKAIGLLETLEKVFPPKKGGVRCSDRMERYFDEINRSMYQFLINPGGR